MHCMDLTRITTMVAIVALILAVVVSSASCVTMLYRKKGLASPYSHPDKEDEFKPLGNITKMTPEEMEYRKDAIQKQLASK